MTEHIFWPDDTIGNLDFVGKPVIRIEVEPITVNTLGGPAPDPKWNYVDKAGHRHTYDGEKTRWSKTLKWVVDETWWCEDCCDEHEEGHLECVQCGERIEPGMVHKPPQTLTRPGPKRYYINDTEVTEAEAEEAIAKWRAENA